MASAESEADAAGEAVRRLKDIPLRIQSASVRERCRVLQQIEDVLAGQGVTEQIVRFLCRVIQSTLHRYRDTTSQSYVRKLIVCLTKNYKEWTLRNLPVVLAEIAEQQKNIATSMYTCQSGLHALRWSTILVQTGLVNNLGADYVDLKTIVLAQANLLATVTAFGNSKKNTKAYSMLHHSWSAVGNDVESKWLSVLLSQPPESGPQLAVMYSALCRHLTDLGRHDAARENKAKMLDAFIKSLISVKSCPNANLIAASRDLLATLDKTDLQSTLFPALQKAMLRNPEVIIEAVGVVFDNLEVDVDEIALDVGKGLIANLHSKEETVRSAAALALENLALHCPDPGCIRTLMQHLFAVYNGANGKLTAGEHKMGVLLGAGSLSHNCVPVVERAKLTTDIATHFAKTLESETHEKTLCYCLEMYSQWLETLSGEMPDYIVDLFKKNISLKSTTALVKISYIQWLGKALERTTANNKQREAINVLLLKSVENAIKQPLQQTIVSEGISAAYVLTKLDASRELPTKHANLWNSFTHKEKQVLLQDKILANATDDVLIQVVTLCKTVLENYPSVASSKTSPIHKAFITVLISPSKLVRAVALDNAKRLLADRNKAQIARSLIAQLNEVLEEGKLLSGKEKGTPAPDERSPEVTGKMIADCITALCSYRDYPVNDARSLAIDTLKCCHHPLLASGNTGLWLKTVRHLKLDPKELIVLFINNLKNEYICGFTPNETTSRVVAALVDTNPDSILPGLISTVMEVLTDPDLLRITRDEYFTYLTPEGELYDKSVVPGNEDNSEMNLKRESKVYTYKDQLEELQLRRELEEKRKREGKVKEVQLSAKQKEAIKLQAAKENAVRQRLTVLKSRLTAAVGLLEAAATGNSVALSTHAKTFLSAMLATLQSPLAAPHTAALYVRLRHIVFNNKFTAIRELVPRVTLRLFKPQCDLDPNWESEDINEATARAINMIHAATVRYKPKETSDNKEKVDKLEVDQLLLEDQELVYFTAPAFCYVFPMLKQGMTCFYASNDNEMVLSGLRVIMHHATLRGDPNEPSESTRDLYHPALLPIDQMFRLLIDLISTTPGRIQTQCTAALLETAACASGKPGCCRATLSEVQCLLSGLQSPMKVVRDAALRALLCLEEVLPDLFLDPDQALRLTKRFWIAMFDVAEENRELAASLWERAVTADILACTPDLAIAVLQDALHPAEDVQKAAANAIAALLSDPTKTELKPAEALEKLLEMYHQRLDMVPARLDQFGHVVEKAVDEWGDRRGVALFLSALAPHLASDAVATAVKFFVQYGLGDRSEEVRAEMLNAAMALVDLHGKDTVSDQLPVFEEFLDKAPKSGGYDFVRQSVVLLVGSLAKHLSHDDPRIRPITLRLISALSTPSEQVQEAVSNCLPHLIVSPVMRAEAQTILNKLLKQLFTADKYGERRGAAYGLAGIVKGLGILSLKQYDIMVKLTDAIQEKKNYRYREGALFALEILCAKLGRLFEPYIVHALPHLLACFGDQSQYVRQAADDTSKLVMSKLSGHGVKLVLPSLLVALQDDNWRTKQGSVDLLGAMAFCAPKQLSSCLPSIVPKLIEVLSDSHMKVQEAGAEALKVISSVIKNPEIQAISKVLLQALQDPSAKTSVCLQMLLDTKFVHFVDAASLALIMPVVQRAFMDRSTETRKMAAQIIGNMYALTNKSDLLPYMPSIIPGLKQSLLDPVPEVRSVSARALGTMVGGIGEASFDDLLPWLMQTLTSESSSVDRSGAAQGLAEVVAGLGVGKLEKIMPDIIATAERTDIAPHVKDGYIMMFIYMPGAFTKEFTGYIGQIINPILKALADENEYVRETALKAGQRIVNLYADSAITLLLPELENGLFDDNWRIRYSSVQLLGDLLYRISGVSGKMSTETASEDDNFGTEQSHSAIMVALGPERRNRVLAGLYMGRSDVALMVRQAALHVWKVVVTNTPRTLREILPTLFGLLLGCLASTSYDKRQVAARTLGDLVRKLGERVLPEIVPILERGLQSDRSDQRQGVCIGLGEIVASTSRDTVLTFVDGLVPTVRKALCDPLPEVRVAAARTFDSLHATVGGKALDDILPFMLEGLNDPDPKIAEATLDGLRQVMAIKSRAVLPYLIPQLTAPPANTRALSALAAAAGDALAKHLHKILPALLTALSEAHDTPNEAKELEYCRGALLPVTDESGVRSIIDALLENSRNNACLPRKRAASSLLCAFVTHTRADLSPYVPQLLRGLILLFAEHEREVLQMAWDALHALTKTFDAEQQIQHVSDVRQAVRYASAELKGETLLPGFCLPKGIAPVLPLFRETILNGLPEDKESAALMLGEIIRLTSPQAIQPSVVHITGPMIRILGDRFASNVKAAVLETLALLLSKVGAMLKQFMPQLQTTFLKALHDTNRSVRIKASYALSQLVVIHARPDPIFIEMHNGVKNTEDATVRETMLQALRSVITVGGDKMSDALVLNVLATLTNHSFLANPEDPPRSSVGGCLGALLHCLPAPHLDAALHHHILSTDGSDWTLLHGRSCALFVALKETPNEIYLEQYEEKINKTLLTYLQSDKVQIVGNGIRGIGYLLRYLLKEERSVPQNLLTTLARCMNHQSNDVKQLLAQVCTMLGRSVEAHRITGDVLRAFVPTLVNGTKEKNSYVKANSEFALIALLKLKEGDEVQKQCMALLEEGARESLNDVVSRSLRKAIAAPEGKEEELDCTLIT